MQPKARALSYCACARVTEVTVVTEHILPIAIVDPVSSDTAIASSIHWGTPADPQWSRGTGLSGYNILRRSRCYSYHVVCMHTKSMHEAHDCMHDSSTMTTYQLWYWQYLTVLSGVAKVFKTMCQYLNVTAYYVGFGWKRECLSWLLYTWAWPLPLFLIHWHVSVMVGLRFSSPDTQQIRRWFSGSSSWSSSIITNI